MPKLHSVGRPCGQTAEGNDGASTSDESRWDDVHNLPKGDCAKQTVRAIRLRGMLKQENPAEEGGDMSATALVYDIQGYSVHDGPGIRTTVFLKGCPLRCPWCHSPESQSFKPQVCFKQTSCLGIERCEGSCLNACPVPGALVRGEEVDDTPEFIDESGEAAPPGKKTVPHIIRSLCDDCAKCTEVCYAKALYVCGEEWTAEDMLKRVLRDRRFYEKSGGGVTLSGGEPLCQLEFAVEFLKRCKEAGLHTALDTTGFVPESSIAAVLPYVDLFLYDLKHMDSDLHKQVIGVPNEPIHANARFIAANGGNLQVRIPVIPRFNDNEENMEKTAALSKELGDAVSLIQLLPYHTLGVSKYERLQWDQPIFEAPPMPEERVKEFAEFFEQRGLNAQVH